MSVLDALLKIRSNSVKGFTLIELMVSIAVMLIIMGITLSGGPQSLARLKLSDDVFKAEILLRETQLQGSAVNSLNGAYGGAGVFFNRATSSEVLKFKDRIDASIQKAIGVGNGQYDYSVDTKSETLFFNTRNKLSKLCVATSSLDVFYCNELSTPAVETLTVSFTRPKQTAHIYINGSSNVDYAAACIQVTGSTLDSVRSLTVYKSGMIFKKNGKCN